MTSLHPSAKMECPRDRTILEPRPLGGVSVATCPRCGGMYLRHGELNEIAHPVRGDLEGATIDQDSFAHPDDHGALSCPNDGTTMAKVDFNVDTNIILDYCRQCGGFWVDADELPRIEAEVKRLNEAEAEVPDTALMRFFYALWDLPIR